jgi:hypothetical protein
VLNSSLACGRGADRRRIAVFGGCPSKRATGSRVRFRAVVAAEVVKAPPLKHFRCESCGAQVAVDPDQLYMCVLRFELRR